MTPPSNAHGLRDCRVLITAGPTHEPIDAVRYLGNRSSGRLGVALAMASSKRAAATTLLLGPCPVPADLGDVELHRFHTTADLQDELARYWPRHDLLIMAAAVADFRPVRRGSLTDKLKRGEGIRLDLEPTPDLLASLSSMTRPGQTRVGFALEPHDRLDESARAKLVQKDLDAIVANPLETMDAHDITARLYRRDGTMTQAPPHMGKTSFAVWLLDQLTELIHPSNAAT